VLSIVKGQFYTYLLFKAAYAENILVDCGFSVYWESDLAQYAGNYAQILKTETGYQFTKISPDEKKLYTYKACVKKIVDGDTIWLDIDCGFKIWANQKIRLRGINAPEITTPKGRQAYKYVCNALNGLPFVVIKSHGRDKYDRYLIDIFYLKGETDPQVVLEKGNFLNQELLDHGLAVRQD
jgi:endonuclease YncB( thermonuclease family)